ncbi:hypothetical protein H4R34_005473 [Dimargaris verticillata]|uniref:Uncharacterized protein n=1 Tax=Dimargaris verticillata TaxID=2761393 RepID=A0A9W8AWG1_9FUNG|nr:hypothetical protein H4R34_005473 [Dimargaris verticillata]
MPAYDIFLTPSPVRIRQGVDQPARLWDLGHYDPEAFPQYTLTEDLKVGTKGHVKAVTKAYQDPTLKHVRLDRYTNFLVSAYCHDAFALQRIRSWPVQLTAMPTTDARDAIATSASSKARGNYLWHLVFYLDARDHRIAAELSAVEFRAMGFDYHSTDALMLMTGSPLAQAVQHRLELGLETYWDLYIAKPRANSFHVTDTMPQQPRPL